MIFMNRKIDVAVGFLSAVVLGTAGLGGESVALCPEKVTKPVMQEMVFKPEESECMNLAVQMSESLQVGLKEQQQKVQEEETARQEEVQKLLASIIFCEAGNQSYEGQVAVGAVVMNRVRSSSFPDSIEEVIYQKGQFVPAGTGWLDKVRNSGGYTDSALKAAKDALAGVNPVGSCLYFDQGGYGMRIGDHYFH